MSAPKRLVTLVAAGLALCVAAVFFPLGAVVVPRWHHHLTVTTKWPSVPSGLTFRLCVSDFRVVAPGVLSSHVEKRAPSMSNKIPYLGDALGQTIVLSAEEFLLYENNERCSRAN